MKEQILVIGTGALSTLFAARLSESGHQVSMLGTWKDGIQALNQNGARVSVLDGTEHAFQVHATDDPGEVSNVKHAIVLVKSWQTKRVAEKLKGILAPDGMVLTLQNGLGNRETLARDLGAGRVALGVTTTGATLLGPGLVKVGGEGVISLGQNQALGQKLADQSAPPRAQSAAQREFPAPRGGTRQHQIREIHADDEEDQADRAP